MSITSKKLVIPLFLTLGFSFSGLVTAENHQAGPSDTATSKTSGNTAKVKAVAHIEPTNTVQTDTTVAKTDVDNKLITPRLEDGQVAFNSGDYNLAFSLWQTLATQGHTDAQVFVGLSYANGWGVDKNPKLASHWYQKAANNNNASAQFLLGLYFVSGNEADLTTGVMWLNRAADNGDISAKRFLKKAKKRGWFDRVPSNKQAPNKRNVETVALIETTL